MSRTYYYVGKKLVAKQFLKNNYVYVKKKTIQFACVHMYLCVVCVWEGTSSLFPPFTLFNPSSLQIRKGSFGLTTAQSLVWKLICKAGEVCPACRCLSPKDEDVTHHYQPKDRAGMGPPGLVIELVAEGLSWLKSRKERRAGEGIFRHSS